MKIVSKKTIDWLCFASFCFLVGIMLWFHGYLFPFELEAAETEEQAAQTVYFANGEASYSPMKDHLVKDPVKVRTTAYTKGDGYTPSNRTATRKPVKYGIVAYMPEYYGWTAILYTVAENGGIGELIGYFDVQDTGAEHIRSGASIDVYQETYADCKEYMTLTHTGAGSSKSQVYVQLVKADG
jgi:3D (Asp-Asp-Asp) domain-containing protein